MLYTGSAAERAKILRCTKLCGLVRIVRIRPARIRADRTWDSYSARAGSWLLRGASGRRRRQWRNIRCGTI